MNRELRSLALLLEQGQPLAAALQRLGGVWAEAGLEVERGASWAEVARELPAPLSSLRADSEDFSESLRLCARLLEDQRGRRRFWRNVGFYPALLCFSGLALGLLVSSVMRMEVLFVGQPEGLAGQMYWVSNLFLANFPWLACLPFVLLALLRWTSLRLRVPVWGHMVRLRESVAFLRWLELARRQQPSLPDAVEQASQGCVVEPMARKLRAMAEQMRAGSLLGEVASGLPAQAQWCLVQAERGGFESLLPLADLLEEQLRYYRQFAASLVALGGYVLAGGMVVWCSLCVMLPLMKMSAF